MIKIDIITENKKYYTCRYDRAFKEVFLKEKNKYMLKDLLELILDIKINEITLNPNERNTGNLEIRRKTYDALLTTDIGKIQIEVNANNENYVRPRNTAYICDLYSHSTLVGKQYNEETMFIQINLSYGLSKNAKPIRRYKIRDEEGKEFVKNLEIIEVNMEYFVNLWYNNEKEKNKKLIDKNKLIIMLGLEKDDLKKLSNEYMEVNKFMDELNKINEDPEFRVYMTYEEDQEKIFNSRMAEADRKGMERGMKRGLEKGMKEGLEKGMKEGLEKGIERGIEQGTKEGLEKGIEKGMEKGLKEGSNNKAREIAKNLLNINLSKEDISKTTGLSIEEIEKL